MKQNLIDKHCRDCGNKFSVKSHWKKLPRICFNCFLKQLDLVDALDTIFRTNIVDIDNYSRGRLRSIFNHCLEDTKEEAINVALSVASKYGVDISSDQLWVGMDLDEINDVIHKFLKVRGRFDFSKINFSSRVSNEMYPILSPRGNFLRKRLNEALADSVAGEGPISRILVDVAKLNSKMDQAGMVAKDRNNFRDHLIQDRLRRFS